jgi:hypothetical protein
MTGDQCREARERIELDPPPARDSDGRSPWFIAAFEDGKATPDFLEGYEVALRAALESAGVIFVEENGEGPGVRLRKPSAG